MIYLLFLISVLKTMALIEYRIVSRQVFHADPLF
jgi:hypothetical protein